MTLWFRVVLTIALAMTVAAVVSHGGLRVVFLVLLIIAIAVAWAPDVAGWRRKRKGDPQRQ